MNLYFIGHKQPSKRAKEALDVSINRRLSASRSRHQPIVRVSRVAVKKDLPARLARTESSSVLIVAFDTSGHRRHRNCALSPITVCRRCQRSGPRGPPP